MQKFKVIFFATAAAYAVSGCATVNSNRQLAHNADGVKNINRGIPSYLPKGKIRVSIFHRTDNQFQVNLEGPIMVGDTDYQFHADLRHGILSDDDIDIKLDASTSLISSVTVDSKGKAAEFLENSAKALGMLQGADQKVGDPFFVREYDIDKLADATRDANLALVSYYNKICGVFGSSGDLSEQNLKDAKAKYKLSEESMKDLKATIEVCRIWKMTGMSSGNVIGITAYPSMDAVLSKPALAKLSASESQFTLNATAANKTCAKGICYRPMVPVEIRLTLAGTYDKTTTFLVPDRSRINYAELNAGAFADQKYALTFDKGNLTGIKYTTKSELVGFSTLPVKLVSAIIAAPGALLGLKQKALTDEDAYLKAVSSNLDQIKKTSENCAASPQGCPDTAYKVMGVGPKADPRREPKTDTESDAPGGKNPGDGPQPGGD
jgi:hypothetical protein